MGDFRRAITREQKQERRQKILDAARELFSESDFASVKILDIAKRTGLGKGSVFLYFESKEDLFLELTMQEFDAWYQKIQFLLLEHSGKGIGGRELLELLDRTFLSRNLLIRLLVTAMTVLEQNAGYEQAVRYKRTLHDDICQLGETLDEKVVYFKEGDGARFLLHCLALLAGTYQMANPSEVVRQAVDCEELPLFQMDFRTSFLEELQIFLNGMMVQLYMG